MSTTTNQNCNIVEIVTRGPIGPAGNGNGDVPTRLITFVDHGLSVFNLVYFSLVNKEWTLGIADPTNVAAVDGIDSADIIGMVAEVIDDDNFRLAFDAGFFESTGSFSAGDIGKKFYLSTTVAGTVQETRPTFPNFVKPIYQVQSTAIAYIEFDTAVQGAPA